MLASPSADPVAEALRTLNVRSSVFCLSEMRAPWAFRVDGADVAKFHLVLAGDAWVCVPGHDPVRIGRRDLILLPRGHAHTVADELGSPVVALERIVRDAAPAGTTRLRYGGSGAVTRLLCGGFSVVGGLADATLALPDVLRVDSAMVGAAAWLDRLLAMLNAEAEGGLLGADAIVTKIAELFLTQALRAWLVAADQPGALVAGQLGDRPIAAALRAIRTRPAESWTLDQLASEVGLARTAFASRFRRLVGEPPMRYLTKLRLAKAAEYLATGQLTVHEVARLSGYDDSPSFSKAFKRAFGRAPGAYRREAGQAPEVTVTSDEPAGP